MKKSFKIAMAATVCAAALFSAVGCGDGPSDAKEPVYSVYCPDGAPALSLLNGLSKEDENFKYRVISSATVQAQVTGGKPAADFCVLPLNLASKLLGTGSVYQMLGTVTNGNLYFLTTGDNALLTSENLNTLVGKTVGAVQLTNVPGLTLQATLKQYGIPYQTVASLQAEKAEDKVNLLQMGSDAGNVTPVFGCDYYLCPEPAVTAKIKGTANSQTPFKLAGNLQELYGGENGYPQAVLVAKKSIIEENKTYADRLISYFKGNAAYFAGAETATVLSLLDKVRTDGLAPAFNEKNLNGQVIQNCSVRYTEAKNCKTAVNEFLAKLIAVNPNAAAAVSDEFYYLG
ncbi:MAG: hypothetical protein OSJ39_02505 [Clostridia bacterium]|nr:hypothetical protein [Clostridia bacterium]